MTTREELVKDGFDVYRQGDNFPPIYWKTAGEKTIVYYETDGGRITQSFDGLTKVIQDKVEIWEQDRDGGWN
ncbi:hypothetical protein LCGC14_0439260 [marine sediment metagenome]|uniref:Uncharacterized protein n=1 Tax=marine sediment metagenome TaxID=412755 RepID=A0A0F9VV36_9ZZZZ